ncbi:uncharacterized protein [Nicotiana tomentosiformis]|uniref:uncharacterized protein n=1 Tax=Nicotiana tomentosiformis TaxID=4098 RepID=UPI0008787579|nr:uncharacterized protein LOC108945852 [Nicotiana tomentosiformis]
MVAIVSPQLQAVGEPNINPSEQNINNNDQQSYTKRLTTHLSAQTTAKLSLKPIHIIHGEPTIPFTREERQAFVVEEGLHQAVVVKLSPRSPDLLDLRSLLPKVLGIKGHCLVGQLAPKQLLIRLNQYEDFVAALARAMNYFSHNGAEHQYRVFSWTIGFNPKEETTMAVVWISLPNLSPELFARKSLLSIASPVGKPIAIDKATQVKFRPSTARVRVIVDLVAKLPQHIRLQHVDNESGKILEVFQEVVYDNLPGYCTVCKHQGHVESACRLLIKKNILVAVAEEENYDQTSIEQLKGDARDYLNAKLLQKQQSEDVRALGRDLQILSTRAVTTQDNASRLNPISSAVVTGHAGIPETGVISGQQKKLQVLAGTNHQIDTVKQRGTGELVVAVTGKKIEQNSNLDEIPVDRALARMAQGLQVERIGHEFQSIEQLQMLKLQADVHQEKATLNEGFEVVPAVADF